MSRCLGRGLYVLALGILLNFGCDLHLGSIDSDQVREHESALSKSENTKFFGMFFSSAGSDSENIETFITDNQSPNRLTVVQDYQSPSSLAGPGGGVPIMAAFAKNNVVHLNIMPVQSYTDGLQNSYIQNFAHWLATTALPAYPNLGILITIGPEMNADWTPEYGCLKTGPNTWIARSSDFITMHNTWVDQVRSELTSHGIGWHRVRFVWGPNWTPDTGTCRFHVYWPGWDHVDHVGYYHNTRPIIDEPYLHQEAYQSGPKIAKTASAIYAASGLDPTLALAAGKAVILQTGAEHGDANYPRATWFNQLTYATRVNPLISGMVIFEPATYDMNLDNVNIHWMTTNPDGHEDLLEGGIELHNEVVSGTTFSASAEFLFSRPQVIWVFPFGSNLVVKGRNFGTAGASKSVRVEYNTITGWLPYSGNYQVVKQGPDDAFYIPLAALPGFDASRPFWAGVGPMDALPRDVITFEYGPNVVIKGRLFGAAGASVPAILEYRTTSGLIKVWNGSLPVYKESSYDVLYISKSWLPGYDPTKTYWGAVGW
jgi:hypothetical protein